MSSDYWNVPLADLESIQTSLDAMAQTLRTVEDGAYGIDGPDDIFGGEMVSAVEEFFADWKGSRRVLIDNINTMGTVSGEIAEAVRQFDTETASGLSEMGAGLRGEGQQE
ncbi:hypothetical protein [Corynebacterium cystitidis]|uniref:hypothetical protein n=1 Tax=Corynebacterium cystitidis TaxID=35757 RepID=UPI00211DD0D5|nr:hypothetical protein [Corynebacterium cystitidis]